jgi:acetoacetyl-[acyl-carrier protein] synthase
MMRGEVAPVYRFDNGVLADGDVEMGAREMRIGDYRVNLDLASPYADMQAH